ncbi:MAG: hypothetical protein OZ923_08785 [Comamonadaceae bacterium]|nr:hypothetical protein [Comamonadaceae bacterium]
MPVPLIRLAARATGFGAGALAGYWLSYFLGVDLLRDAYSSKSLFAVAAVGIGAGIGLAAARHWCAERGYDLEQ